MTIQIAHVGLRGIMLVLVCGALGACHTVAGMGEDVQAAGHAIHNAATK